MKQKTYIIGLVTAMIISTGIILKVNHWPMAGMLLTIGIFILVFLFLPLALVNNYKAKGNNNNRLLYIVTWITCFVVFTAMLFKIQHWPYAGVGLFIALPFPYIVFLPVFLIVTSRNKNFNIYNTVFVLLLLAMNSVFAGLLAINVSKNTIVDSFNISHDYKTAEEALAQLPVNNNESAVNLKINEIVKITNDYQDLILKHEGLTRTDWEKNPGNLVNAESTNIATSVLANNGEAPAGIHLKNALNELVDLMKQTKGYEEAARVLPSITGLEMVKGDDPYWAFTDKNLAINLSWALTYLDGLKANLLMIKASHSAII